MSGFDEGGIYYSDQQFVTQHGAAHGDEAAPQLSRAQALAKFGEFIRAFQIDPKSSTFYYADQLARCKDRLRVDIGHLSHDVYGIPELQQALVENPAEYLPILEQAAKQESQRIQSLLEDGSDPDVKDVQVLLYKGETGRSRVPHVTMRDIKPEAYVSKLVIVPGIVTAASRPKHKATYIMLQCKECKATKKITCRPGVGGALIPRMCDAAALPGQSNQCGQDPYIVLADRAECVDQQTLKMQERPEDVPTGDLPRSMMCLVDRRLVGSVSPGTRVTAVGILSIFQGKDGGGNQRDKAGAVAIRQPYLRVIGFQEDVLNGDTARRPTFSLEEEAEFKEFAAQPGASDRIFARIAPQIFGSPDIKKAIACLLFGGSRKRMPDGTYRRGDINVLLLGDPSTAKSQFLKFTSKTAPIAVYTSGKGSSAAGLTASVIRDPASKEFYLEGGAMVLADGGVVCIDEFDKMRPEDRVAIHEAMEQQTISIAKAGITTMLRSRTSVLAAANPPSGRYDDLKSAQENIDLQSTILSRFDLIFIVKDERSAARDMQIAKHVLDVHRMAGTQPEADEEEKREEAFLKRYIEYCRQSCSPRIVDSAAKLLANEYVELRAESKCAAGADGSDIPAIPVTVRQLEAVIRISESLAKMNLQTTASEAHVRQALELFKTSTMDAVKSGLMDVAVFTDEQRQEVHRVEEQIKRRVAIGSFVSERKLVDELVRVGFSENLVRKGLMFLQTTGDFEYRRERRLVHRMK
ncbi:DNA replication licensing factor MCM5 [Micractinium conductrix]|uniref:DNA replication licensing factor MCM5 n=1 Tax=Micractinium conductrix TaxID=554055 RepID=A0A2P6VF91_9CHLO|nr:DNA replication licensing factor MCM5 [Micractinium conductrix]|eukprot:PSC72741.1 DNA replication licensing factor MCM5 [Micractinium conductrix]